MTLLIPATLLLQIQALGEQAYPEEGAGFLLGTATDNQKLVRQIWELPNRREPDARHNRYLISAEDYMQAELQAEEQGLDVLGVFHSHPDHPNQPSEFDREWGLPWFSYIITSVYQGNAIESRSWQLAEDRSAFHPEDLVIQVDQPAR